MCLDNWKARNSWPISEPELSRFIGYLSKHNKDLYRSITTKYNDLLLMAPSRSAMEKMLSICEKYALDLNLEFSTNEDPKKSKSKSIFMTGAANLVYRGTIEL